MKRTRAIRSSATAIAPDLVAPIQVQSERLVVPTLLGPRAAYAPAQAVVERQKQLPDWVLDAWELDTEGDGITGEG